MQEVQNDPRQEWYCQYASWDLATQPPHKPACSLPAAGVASGGGGGSSKRGRRKK